jgi:hypothetical protein
MTSCKITTNSGCIIRKYIKLNDLTIKGVADYLGIAAKTLRSKLEDGNFTIREVNGLIRVLKIEEPQTIFFLMGGV